jgi:hypothetical protein
MFGVIEFFTPGFYIFFKYLLNFSPIFWCFHIFYEKPLVLILKNKLKFISVPIPHINRTKNLVMGLVFQKK